MKRPAGYDRLVTPEQRTDAHGRGERVVTCAQCDNACERKPEKQTAFCARIRILVSSTTPVVCPFFFPAR